MSTQLGQGERETQRICKAAGAAATHAESVLWGQGERVPQLPRHPPQGEAPCKVQGLQLSDSAKEKKTYLHIFSTGGSNFSLGLQLLK